MAGSARIISVSAEGRGPRRRRGLLLHLAIQGVGIWTASVLVDGIRVNWDDGWSVILMVVCFALVNAVLKPLFIVLGLPFLLLTLGLFLLIINGLMLYITAGLSDALYIAGFWEAVWGGIIVGATSWLVGTLHDGR